MATTTSITVPDELKNLYNKAIERSDPFTFGTAQAHKSLTPDARRVVLREQSLFRFLAPIWRALTTEEKQVWKDAGVYSGINGWQLFISDNSARIRNDLALDVPPSDLWQVNAGQITIASPASEILLKQEHPQAYWVAQKVVGASWKKELVLITETFSLPLELEIRYKSDLLPAEGFAIPDANNTISGYVTLDGEAVEGAVVRCIRQSDNVALTADTTDSTGFYEFTSLTTDEVYDIAVEYETGGTKYHANNFPFRSWFETNIELVAYTVPDGDAVDFALSEYGTNIPRARYYAEIWTSYQGVDYKTAYALNFDDSADWTLLTTSISDLRGIIIGYTLYLDIYGYTGTLLFDNIRATHSGSNWARDPRCDSVNQTFRKAFSIVPPFWVPTSLPTGSSFASYYPPAL